MKWLLALGMGLSLVLPVQAADSQAALQARLKRAKEARILFVGNSYSFKVPGTLGRLAKASKRKVVVEQVTKGGWTLQKHAAAKETLAKIRSGNWDVVVLQEQSQMPSFSQQQRNKQMLPHAKTLVAEIRKAGAVPVFFQTWGRRDGDKQNSTAHPNDTFEKMQVRLIAGYRETALASGGALIVPVGERWSKEMKAGKGKRLFAKDGSHPSPAGVELSAEVFYTYFFGG